MTEVLPRDTGAASGTGVVHHRLTGLPLEEFAAQHWGRKPLLHSRSGSYDDLFSAAAADELLSRRGLRTPFLRMAKNGLTLPDASFTRSAGVGAGITDQIDDTAVWRHFAGGATIVLQALHRTWEPVACLVSQLEDELGHPLQANAYITPPQNQGFDDHYDVHDVFVLQVEGTKRWVIHEPVLQHPLRDQPWTDRRDEVARAAAEPAVIDEVLRPGDCLYLPRGWLHSATAQGAVSIHLTLGVHTWTRYALAERLVQEALSSLRDDPYVRESLPAGDLVGEDHELRARVLNAVQRADSYADLRAPRAASARPGPLGPLAQLAAVARLTDDTWVRVRPGVQPRLDGGRLHSRVGWIDVDETDGLQQLLRDGAIRAGDLGALVQRLLRAGVVTADHVE